MDEQRPMRMRAAKVFVRLALGIGLFGLIAPATAESAPQPLVCPSAHAISV